MAAAAHPLVILILDSGDWRQVEQWAPAGFLPTLAGLRARGTSARIAGPEQLCEHGLRLSTWTGLSANVHGGYAIRQLQPGTYELGPWNAHARAARPFWHRLGGNGRKLAIIDVPESFVQPGLPGLQLMDWTTLMPDMSRFPPSAEPPALLAEAERQFGPREEFREYKPNQTFAEDRALYARFQQRCARYGALCRQLLAGQQFDLTMIGFFEAHCAGHQFWKYRPEAPQGGTTELAHAIRDLYTSVDREMGLLLQQLPADANVCVLSLFGLDDGHPVQELMQNFCRELGYLVPAPAAAGRLSPLGLARRLVPRRLRVALSQRLSRATQERLLNEQFRSGTDWSRTTAFAIPNLFTGMLRVNLRGREPQGIVDPGAEYTAVLDRLDADLRQLVDPVTGAPAVARVVRTADHFRRGPHPSLPDLFVHWKPAPHFLREIRHPRVTLTQQPLWYSRDNEHTAEGFLIAAGPSIRPQAALGPVNILDLAPTFLALLGEPAPAEMPGRVLTELLRR